MDNVILSISVEIYNEIKKMAEDVDSKYYAIANKLLAGVVQVWMDEKGSIDNNIWDQIKF